MDVIYRYDGTLEGFLCCVFESYVNKEPPMGFQGPEELEPTLFPVRWVETDSAHAQRIHDLPPLHSSDSLREKGKS